MTLESARWSPFHPLPIAALWRDLRHAVRGCPRRHGSTAAALVVLAAATDMPAAMLSVAHAVLVGPLAVRAATRVGPAVAMRAE